MNVYNYSSTNYALAVAWPDGSSQTVVLPAGSHTLLPGVTIAGTTYLEDWSHCYEAVVTDAGPEVHALTDPQTVFISAFAKGLVISGLVLAVWLSKRGLRPSLGRD